MFWAATGRPATCDWTGARIGSTAPTRRLAGTGPAGRSAYLTVRGSPTGCSSRSPRSRGTDRSSSSRDSVATRRVPRRAPCCGRGEAEMSTPGVMRDRRRPREATAASLLMVSAFVVAGCAMGSSAAPPTKTPLVQHDRSRHRRQLRGPHSVPAVRRSQGRARWRDALGSDVAAHQRDPRLACTGSAGALLEGQRPSEGDRSDRDQGCQLEGRCK
jgi:hypothetical protein